MITPCLYEPKRHKKRKITSCFIVGVSSPSCIIYSLVYYRLQVTLIKKNLSHHIQPTDTQIKRPITSYYRPISTEISQFPKIRKFKDNSLALSCVRASPPNACWRCTQIRKIFLHPNFVNRATGHEPRSDDAQLCNFFCFNTRRSRKFKAMCRRQVYLQARRKALDSGQL